jgi:hypothetical protein
MLCLIAVFSLVAVYIDVSRDTMYIYFKAYQSNLYDIYLFCRSFSSCHYVLVFLLIIIIFFFYIIDSRIFEEEKVTSIANRFIICGLKLSSSVLICSEAKAKRM